MSSMAYLALANHIKIYDEDGNKISLYNAYHVTDIQDNQGNSSSKYGKTLELKGTFYKSKEDITKHRIVRGIIDKLNTSLSSKSLSGGALKLTLEEWEYIDLKGYNIASIENTKTLLEEDDKKLTWTVDDESEFMDKAREINNRMHGIYNNQDKVTL